MISYRRNLPLATADVIRVLDGSGIVRPTQEPDRIAAMYAASNILISAWEGNLLVGVCRALSDGRYVCYLSDLAVDKPWQRHGIGKRLLAELQAMVGEEVSVVLLAAPGAMGYYPKLGFAPLDNGWTVRRVR